ncbi:hypothetical protein [Gloeomargarita sp.]
MDANLSHGGGDHPLTWRISPLVRYPLYGLYAVLLGPLPFLAWQQGYAWATGGLTLGLLLGWGLLSALLSQRVAADATGLRVFYPAWVPSWLARGWQVHWSEVVRIATRPTGQGGRVHYLVTTDGQGYLIPMRVSGFKRLLDTITQHTGLPTAGICPLAQPWMYAAIGLCVLILLPFDLWLIAQTWQGNG